jgi:hypothetical protein
VQFLEIGTSRNSVVTKSLDCRGSLSPVLKKNLQLAGPKLGRRREENIASMRLPEIGVPCAEYFDTSITRNQSSSYRDRGCRFCGFHNSICTDDVRNGG